MSLHAPTQYFVHFLILKIALHENAVKKFSRSRAREQKRCLSPRTSTILRLSKKGEFVFVVCGEKILGLFHARLDFLLLFGQAKSRNNVFEGRY